MIDQKIHLRNENSQRWIGVYKVEPIRQKLLN